MASILRISCPWNILIREKREMLLTQPEEPMRLHQIWLVAALQLAVAGPLLSQTSPPPPTPEQIQNAPRVDLPKGPVRISGGVMAGLLLTKVQPVYPAEAKAAGRSGRVVLRALIGTDGKVKDLKVMSGDAELGQAALDAVKQWTYKPYVLNGELTEVDTTVVVDFQPGSRPRVHP